MTPDEAFSPDYAQARDRFRDAARGAVRAVSLLHPAARGPGGEPLSLDAAWFGPIKARAVLVVLSGTHGVEGFCGSAMQLALLSAGVQGRLGEGVALMLAHAINPYGFAHLRRFDDRNVDLNRNFLPDFAAAPANPLYDELHPLLLPARWDEDKAAADAGFAALVARDGPATVNAALTRGQYAHPDGLFYGGEGPAWSTRTWRALAADWLADARRLAVLDIHTGLGPSGHGELMSSAAGARLAAARAVFGDEVRAIAGTEAVAAPVSGDLLGDLRASPGCEVAPAALEFGTLPPLQVLEALRRETWTHHAAPGSDRDRAAKAALLAAFRPDDPAWRAAVVTRGLSVVERALDAMNRLSGDCA